GLFLGFGALLGFPFLALLGTLLGNPGLRLHVQEGLFLGFGALLGFPFLALLGTLLGNPGLRLHVQEVIQARQKEAPFLLPEEAFGDNPRVGGASLEQLGPEFFFGQNKISEILGSCGYSAERLSAPYVPQLS
ncbi:protein EFR3 homolog B-like, partial [Cyanistes caeruleus]|uniref:protein EFR3 homolog B-like n=1 Tax=Cyanistes caeruleus TaxID=156563 RepID=UPI000CDA9E63